MPWSCSVCRRGHLTKYEIGHPLLKEKEMNDKNGSTHDSTPDPLDSLGEYVIRMAVGAVVFSVVSAVAGPVIGAVAAAAVGGVDGGGAA
jgi:hypothetical protein